MTTPGSDHPPVAPADVWLVGYCKDTSGATQRLRKASGSNSLDTQLDQTSSLSCAGGCSSSRSADPTMVYFFQFCAGIEVKNILGRNQTKEPKTPRFQLIRSYIGLHVLRG